MEKTSGKKFQKFRYTSREVVLVFEILENAVPFATESCGKFEPRPKFRTGKFRSRTAFTI